MDSLFEFLVPLIIILVYFFGNLFSKGDVDDAGGGPPHSGQDRRGREPDPEASERHRKIREEIQKKADERKKVSGGGSVETGRVEPAAEDTPDAARDDAARDAGSPDPYRRPAEAGERYGQTGGSEQPYERPYADAGGESRKPHASADAGAQRKEGSKKSGGGDFSWGESGGVYQKSIQDRIKQIEATKRQAEALQKKAKSAYANTGSGSSEGGWTAAAADALSTDPVLKALRDPRSARVAFIYGEVLRRPVGLRDPDSAPPGLQ